MPYGYLLGADALVTTRQKVEILQTHAAHYQIRAIDRTKLSAYSETRWLKAGESALVVKAIVEPIETEESTT